MRHEPDKIQENDQNLQEIKSNQKNPQEPQLWQSKTKASQLPSFFISDFSIIQLLFNKL